jgi:nicotinamidase-related amidase
MSFFRLKPEESILLVVDVQDRLVPAMFEAERVVKNNAVLAETARILDIPIIVTEQNPKRLGSTSAIVAKATGDVAPIAKTLFSACTTETLAALEPLRAAGRTSVVLSGLETHVCILQTGLDLLEAGYTVFLPNNAISSRYETDKAAGLARVHRSGAIPASTEMLVFEWVGDASSPAFKQVLPLIK